MNMVGRKRLPEEFRRQTVTVRVPGWLLDWLYHHKGSVGEIVEEALIRQYNLTPPSKELHEPEYRQ